MPAFIASEPMVVLFDEFDAIGKERSDHDEHGELKRVVNAVLQMFDEYRGKSLIIAATNHDGMLDSAIWRRFDEVLSLGRPTLALMQLFLHQKLRGVRRDFDISSAPIKTAFKSYSFAGAERVVRRAIKAMILRGDEFLRLSDIELSRGLEKVTQHK